MSVVVSIKNLNQSYAERNVLKHLNWDIQTGDIIGLLGKNGAGKSTLLESIMNLRHIRDESVNIWGKNWNQLTQAEREKIAFVAQDTKGFEWMKIDDFLQYLGGFFSGYDASYAKQLLKRWDLKQTKNIGELSGGQRQIVKVVQALSVKPELLILDEPVAHLDPSIRRQFLGELMEQAYELNSTVIFSTHIVSDLERVANKVALLIDGKIDYFYEVDELKSNIAHVKISHTEAICELPSLELANWRTHHFGATGTIIRPQIDTHKTVFEQIKQHYPDARIDTIPLSLEDWYLEVNHASI